MKVKGVVSDPLLPGLRSQLTLRKNLQLLQATISHRQISSWRGTPPRTVHVSPVPIGSKFELDHWCHKENQA